MSDEHDAQMNGFNGLTHPIQRSDSSSSTTTSENNDSDNGSSILHQPVPLRPRMPSRKSSGPLAVHRDSSAVGPVDAEFGPDDVRAMSPRRTSEDINRMGQEARDEMRRIEAVREEHDKLDNNNKFLQKYIGDLMSTSKITASGSRGKK
ncbi:hypothetical protein AAL_05235 [Moelleriella libera RCEF 2490]|uniref:BZIP transcription factor n=1 Tax=Moelleriella libera RCEF 2490 TaxID=1081109 RepID=A0A168AS23_9HYPO|nr:hypothetical protein AAL_05235 [Moelleriella libera RCEF 2490]